MLNISDECSIERIFVPNSAKSLQGRDEGKNWNLVESTKNRQFEFIDEQTTDKDNIIMTKEMIDEMQKNCKITAKIQASSLNELLLRYKIKGESEESHILFNDKCNTFCQIISDVMTEFIISNQGIDIQIDNEKELKSNIIYARSCCICY